MQAKEASENSSKRIVDFVRAEKKSRWRKQLAKLQARWLRRPSYRCSQRIATPACRSRVLAPRPQAKAGNSANAPVGPKHKMARQSNEARRRKQMLCPRLHPRVNQRGVEVREL